MPAVPRPGPHTQPNAQVGKIVYADNGPASRTVPAGGRPAEALRAWHDLNMAVARGLPTALLRAGQLEHATRLALRNRSRVRR